MSHGICAAAKYCVTPEATSFLKLSSVRRKREVFPPLTFMSMSSSGPARSHIVWFTGRMVPSASGCLNRRMVSSSSPGARHADDHMNGQVDARCKTLAQAFAAIGVAGHFQSMPVRFIDDSLVFLQR